MRLTTCTFLASTLRHPGLARAITVGLLLALTWGAAPPTRVARAAPTAAEGTLVSARWYLRFTNPPRLCVGRPATIRVTPLAEITGKINGAGFQCKDCIIPGPAIKAEITDTSIATVSPASQSTGVLPKSLFSTHGFSMLHPEGLGEATFTVVPLKAGSTSLILTAQVPSQWSDGAVKFFGPRNSPPSAQIEVGNCLYRVQVRYLATQSGPGYSSIVLGSMDTTIQGEQNVLSGEGTLTTNRTASLQGCSFGYSGFASPTKLSGSISGLPGEGQLTLGLDYQPGAWSASIACPGAGGSPSGTENPGSWLPHELTFSEHGGMVSNSLEFAHWSGAVTVWVTPLKQLLP